MSVFNYKKYRILLNADTKKIQGLRTGDIVRRQYYDGNNSIYSLMCVLGYGEANVDGKAQSYFDGALLEGNHPQTSELLDFARVTNLFDCNRSGALYFTASDGESPYMDVVDGIAKNSSFCWPEGVNNTDYEDSVSQYIVKGKSYVESTYLDSENGDDSKQYSRICTIKRNSTKNSSGEFIGLSQKFYQYVANPNRILISYWVKSSKQLNYSVALSYSDDLKSDGTINETSSTDWQYKLHVITVDWSGRHLRTLKIDLSKLSEDGDQISFSGLNIIALSSLSNFQESSQIRVGKLTGIVDPVFGQLDGYGGYLQKLYATGSAHVSGTLTAGDENGFAATFYAGRIHRNAFINSLSPSISGEFQVSADITSPTGVGSVFCFGSPIAVTAQKNSWCTDKKNSVYTFSFWLYSKNSGTFQIFQNEHLIKTISVTQKDAHKWKRFAVSYKIISVENATDDLFFTLSPVFDFIELNNVSENVKSTDENVAYFTSPQLEKGLYPTQYQPTDAVLNYTEDFGAWFNRGGIGGTIQNPLLQLNYQGKGAIASRSQSFLLNTDGSGHIAKGNIKWDDQGKVIFGDQVTLNWENIEGDMPNDMKGRSLRIIGNDMIGVIVSSFDNSISFDPKTVQLTAILTNMDKSKCSFSWSYLNDEKYVQFIGESLDSIDIKADGDFWNGGLTLTIQCSVIYDGETYCDVKTLRKRYMEGFVVKIESSQGDAFHGANCQTQLKAKVYYQGKLLSDEVVSKNFVFTWHKYHANDPSSEVTDCWNSINQNAQSITLDYQLDGSDIYTCELQDNGNGFDYDFDAVF